MSARRIELSDLKDRRERNEEDELDKEPWSFSIRQPHDDCCAKIGCEVFSEPAEIASGHHGGW